MKRFDVCVVGAGPAGSSAAIFLARKGYTVALLEKRQFPREKLCGDFLNPANWEIFEKLGIQTTLLSLAHEKVGFFRISTASATAKIPFPTQNGRHAFGIGLRRSLFDNLLRQLAEKEGVTVKQQCKPIQLGRNGSDWILTCRDSIAEEKIHARLLIGADGRNSWVAHHLGAAVPEVEKERFVGFQLHLRGRRVGAGEVQIYLFPGGYGGVVGLGGGMATLCFIIEEKLARENPAMEDHLKKHLYRNSRLEKTLEGGEMIGESRSVFPVYFSPRRCFGDGFLLAGDAARVTEPVTGEGVYFALKSGELAAEAAVSAFKRSDLSARQLSGYESVCRRVFGRRQRINAFVHALIHRPSVVTPLLSLFPVRMLVNWVCRSAA